VAVSEQGFAVAVQKIEGAVLAQPAGELLHYRQSLRERRRALSPQFFQVGEQ
jgi:hypothetical protein